MNVKKWNTILNITSSHRLTRTTITTTTSVYIFFYLMLTLRARANICNIICFVSHKICSHVINTQPTVIRKKKKIFGWRTFSIKATKPFHFDRTVYSGLFILNTVSLLLKHQNFTRQLDIHTYNIHLYIFVKRFVYLLRLIEIIRDDNDDDLSFEI